MIPRNSGRKPAEAVASALGVGPSLRPGGGVGTGPDETFLRGIALMRQNRVEIRALISNDETPDLEGRGPIVNRRLLSRAEETGPARQVLARVSRGAAAAVVGVLSLACASTVIPPSNPLVDNVVLYRVGPSDKLSVRVLPDPAIEQAVVVRPDGRFSLDLIGDVVAEGHTTDEIARAIEERMSEYRQSPSVRVSLEEAVSTAVSVVGEVKAPTSFPMPRGLRVSEALAQAGGVTELAASRRIRVVRGEGAEAKLYVANFDKINLGDAESDFLLEPGDLVYVPPAQPVSVGYAIRRALFPLEQILRIIVGPVVGFLATGG